MIIGFGFSSSGKIKLENVGPELAIDDLKLFDIPEPTIKENSIEVHVAIHDERYGSLWTNIPYDTFDQWDASQAKVRIRIFKEEQLMYENELPVGQSFQDINLNQAILYANSLQNVGVALNQINNERAFINRGFSDIKQ